MCLLAQGVSAPQAPASAVNHLPPEGFQRWTPARKLAVVAAVQRGELAFGEALDRYDLSTEELASWQRNAEAFGRKGLKATRHPHRY